MVNSSLISLTDNDHDGLGLTPSPGSTGAALILVTRWRMGASWKDNVGKWFRLAWIPPALETRKFWQPPLSIKIHFQVEKGS